MKDFARKNILFEFRAITHLSSQGFFKLSVSIPFDYFIVLVIGN